MLADSAGTALDSTLVGRNLFRADADQESVVTLGTGLLLRKACNVNGGVREHVLYKVR